ncbi:acetate--CoA ligase family protein [Chloroflexota bacterium]
MDHFEALFNPETVAVVGASNVLDKWGAGIFTRVLKAPTIKRAYPVNNHATEVQRVKAYPAVRDLPETVDFVAIAIPYPGVPDVIRDCVEKGVKTALIITAGLGETGQEGAEIERELVRIASKGGLRLIGPNCMGHFNTANDFSTLRGEQEAPIESGKVGVISQSGGFARHILDCGTDLGTGFSKMVSVGNEADLHFEDFFEYFAQDDETKVITGYIEGLKYGRDFFRLAKEVTKKKPVVVVKVGKTEAGTRAARSHTGHIAGSDIVYDAMFKQAGVIRVETVEELFDVASALLRLPLPRGNRAAILGGGGGFCCVTSDACERLGLKIAPLLPRTIEQLNAVLPDRWPHANPVDTVAAGYGVTFPCFWPLIEDDNLDALLVIGGIGGMSRLLPGLTSDIPSVREQAEQVFKAREKEELEDLDKLFEYMDKYQKPVIVSSRITEAMRSSPVFKKLKENGVLMYPTPERAAKVLFHLVEYSRYLNSS